MLETRHLGGEPRWRLAVPQGRTPIGLVVVLHGRGGDADSAFDDLGLGEHVERTGLAVVSVDGGNGYWHPRRDGTDAGAMGPRRVRAAVAVSAALWLQASDTPGGAFDDREGFERHTIFARTAELWQTPVRLECGTSDPFIAANRALAPRLARATARFDSGGHDSAYWRSHAGTQLDWLAAELVAP